MPTSILFKGAEIVDLYMIEVINRSLTAGVVPDGYKLVIDKPLLQKPVLEENNL